MDQITQFFEAVLGAQANTGVAILAAFDANKNVIHRGFDFPQDIAGMVKFAKDNDAAGQDVYLSMALFQRDERGNAKAQEAYAIGNPCIWLDADSCKPRDMAIEPAIVLESSPARYQMFWPLPKMIPTREAQEIVKALSYQHRVKGADVGGHSCVKLMRVPCTHNYKPIRESSNGHPKVSLEKLETTPVDVSIFSAIPAPTEQQAKEKPEYTGPMHEYPNIPDLPPLTPTGYMWNTDFKYRWSQIEVGDRSEHIYILLADLYCHRLSDAQMIEQMFKHPVALDEWGTPEATLKDFGRIIEKLHAKNPQPYLLDKPQGEEDTAPRIFTAYAVTKLEEPPWIVPGYLPAKAQINLYGPSGIGKSLAVLDWAFRLSLGMKWNDRDVAPIPVLYVVAEGLTVTQQRIEAWAKYHWGESYEAKLEEMREQLMFYGQSVQLLNDVSVKRLRMDINSAMRNVPQLIIFDTLSQCIIGANENSPEDMSRVNGVMEELRREYSCSTLLVHHTGYENDHERGHSSFPASADTRVKVEAYMGQLTLDCEKQRGAEPFDTVYLDFVKRDPSVLVNVSRSQATTLTEDTLRPYHVKIMKTLAGSKQMSTHEVAALCAIPERRFLRYRAELELSRLVSRPTGWDKMVQLTIDGEEMYKRMMAKQAATAQTLSLPVSSAKISSSPGGRDDCMF
jgi:hypothetical protein